MIQTPAVLLFLGKSAIIGKTDIEQTNADFKNLEEHIEHIALVLLVTVMVMNTCTIL